MENILSYITSQIKSIALRDIASLVQISFYIIGSIIAILTYRGAKRGLLNTVNTEYQKRVMDHLEKLSEFLYDEFRIDPEDDTKHGRLYPNDTNIISLIESIVYSFKEHEDPKSFKIEKIFYPPVALRLSTFRGQVKSDPFIPDEISNYVILYLTHRIHATVTVTKKVIRELEETLKNGTYDDLHSLPENVNRIYYERLENMGFGYDDVEIEVHEIRTKIKDYLKSYNPLP
ncbi:hypothetical protein [Priestia megaterium]|uniref:hypothetical protein n=1 Tax=Priestia megaterium TaxID=1404 RepID=UPI0021D66AFA|nr:hypothetical protein [Priestia megaterium]MCU7741535.1 hypothetical protein [Priestia megaterium]